LSLKDFLKDKRVCIIGAHPDDLELGMAGTLNQIKELDIRLLIMSPSTNIAGNSGITQNLLSSMESFGLHDSYHLYQFTTRHFHEERSKIKDVLYEYKDYDFFFTHSPRSLHSDHRVIAESLQEVTKNKFILCFENINDNVNMKVNWWNEISSEDLMAKYHALDFYTTQKKRPYFNDDCVSTLAKMRGNQIGKIYAEGFEFVRGIT
jgi:LmbE family N-acetylglucosaminyl deacetylase